MLKEFKEFAMKGNVLDMAIGIIIGAAFGKIISSLVNDMLMPPIGLVIGKMDFSDLFVTLKAGTPAGPYATLAAAQGAGAVTINTGRRLWISRMRANTSKPFMPGSITSSSTRSGGGACRRAATISARLVSMRASKPSNPR